MNDAATDTQRDYRDTVFLPQTSFPMRGDLPKKEPQILARWDAMDLWSKLRASSAGRPLFILHDGPPYANGNIHIGTALNKIHKDVMNRTRQMAGYDADWDRVEPHIRANRAVAQSVDSLTYVRSVHDLQRFSRRLVSRWGIEFDILVSPTMTIEPPPAGEILAAVHAGRSEPDAAGVEQATQRQSEARHHHDQRLQHQIQHAGGW